MTVYQQQCLLSFLGFDCGDIDGIWGEKTAAATLAFQQRYGLKGDGIFGPATEKKIRSLICEEADPWRDIPYFPRQEFACRCGNCGGFPAEPAENLVQLAVRIRKEFGAPVTVSSGVRCPVHNMAVGGVANSRHLTGKAMDFSVQGRSAQEVLAAVNRLPGVRYAYAIDGAYVHMDGE